MKIKYREHEAGSNPRMRVWVKHWPGDCFEVCTAEEFAAFKAAGESVLAKNLGISFDRVDDED